MKVRKAAKMKLKTRAHRVLFAKDTPFKPKRVEVKTRYRRHDKHKGKHDE